MNNIKIKARGVILEGNQLFLVKLADTGWGCLPGGTLEPNETVPNCLKREILEELGIMPNIGDIIFIQQINKKDGETIIDFWYEITNSNDFKNIDITSSSHGFELLEAGFYNIYNIPFEYKPKNLIQIIKDYYETKKVKMFTNNK